MFSSLRRWGASISYARLPRGPQAQKCSPEKNASFFSKMTYSWFSRIIILGYKKPLEREDLFELNESDSSYTVCPIFEKQWRKEVLRNQERQKVKSSFHKETHTRKPSLLCALWNTFKFVLIQVALFKVFAVILSFTCPLIMKNHPSFCVENKVKRTKSGRRNNCWKIKIIQAKVNGSFNCVVKVISGRIWALF